MVTILSETIYLCFKYGLIDIDFIFYVRFASSLRQSSDWNLRQVCVKFASGLNQGLDWRIVISKWNIICLPYKLPILCWHLWIIKSRFPNWENGIHEVIVEFELMPNWSGNVKLMILAMDPDLCRTRTLQESILMLNYYRKMILTQGIKSSPSETSLIIILSGIKFT